MEKLRLARWFRSLSPYLASAPVEFAKKIVISTFDKQILLALALLFPAASHAQSASPPPGYTICTLDANGNCNLLNAPPVFPFDGAELAWNCEGQGLFECSNSPTVFQRFAGPSVACNNQTFGDLGNTAGAGTNNCYIPTNPPGFQFCSVEHTACQINVPTAEYAFGANGHFVFRTTSNYGTNCDVTTFGGTDPAPGVVKSCFIAFPIGPYYSCAQENQTCNFLATNTIDVAFGANGNFVHRRFNADPNSPPVSSTLCASSSFFNVDPAPGQDSCYTSPVLNSVPYGYTKCADENSSGLGVTNPAPYTCSFSGPATVAFGVNGNFVFSNLTGPVACDRASFNWEDPAPGIQKSCYISSDPPGYTKCADENSQCSFNGPATVAFGADGYFVYQTLTGGAACSDSVFGDPAYGVVKSCYLPAGPSGYQFCSSENNTCHLPNGGTVYFGFNGSFLARSFASQSGGVDVPCNHSIFNGDPAPNVVKACFIMP